jgi:hypothetical protein
MSKRKWEVTVDGQPHQIEFSISPWTNKRSIIVDGSKVDLPKKQRKIQWDTGTKHEFEVSGHEAVIATRTSGFDIKPYLYIDGKDVDTGSPIDYDDQTESTEESIKARRTGVVLIFLVIGIGLLVLNAWLLLSSGGYFPFLALLGPALVVMGVYYVIFSEDPWELPSPISLRLILFLILAFGLGIANWWASENGWYFLLFYSG